MTKERLRQYLLIKQEKEQLEDQLRELEAAMYCPKVPKMSALPSAPSKENAIENMAIRHEELRRRYETKIAELDSEKLAIETAISSLDPTARMLMRYRYFKGLTWEEVCVSLNYSWTQTHRIHARALKLLENVGD